MTTEDAPQETNEKQEPNKDPVKSFTRYVFAVVIIIFIWYLIADRRTPYTDQARVQAYVIPIATEIPGKVDVVNVKQNDIVERGATLFSLAKSDYELSVELAEANLEMAGQEIGAGMATIVTTQAQLVEAQTNLQHVITQSARVYELEKRNIYSKSEGDKARAAVIKARAQVRSAEANLDKSKQSLGVQGSSNPRIRTAMAKLKQAQLNLSRTTLVAPSTGGITNLAIDAGYYASPGAPVMTFIDADDIWIEANLKENNLANLKVGDPVEISLDISPGTIYKGSVRSIGFAVAGGTSAQVGGLTTIEARSGWLRDPQRFPVIISFDDKVAQGLRRVGGQADVQFYTSENILLNGIAKIYIRVLSWMSYVY